MYDYPQQPDGMQPHTAGILLALFAACGIAFFVLSAILGRTDDPMYDRSSPEQRNSAEVQMTPDLWKRKQPVELPPPTPQPRQPVTPAESPTTKPQ
jgi:hypothetical protein